MVVTTAPNDKSLRCARCLLVHDDATWAKLTVVERFDAQDLSAHMTTWPWSRDAVVEARRCSCGVTVARAVVL